MPAPAPVDTDAPVTPPRPRSRRRAAGAAVALVLVVLLAVPAYAALRVVTTARADDRTTTDAVVVLGAAQFWGRPSPVLQARLQHAETLYDDGVAARLITVGANQPGDRTTEAEAGREWLVRAGVPARAVVAVPEGHDTLTSLTAVAAVMAENGWTSATIVTDPAHEARSVAMARALGIDARPSSTSSGAGSGLTAEYVARETLALLAFWVVDRGSVQALVRA